MRERGLPVHRSFIIVNHGDYPIAFQVQVTDKWSYYVDHKNGVIPPKQAMVNATIRMVNSIEIHIIRRTHSNYQDEERGEFWHRPHEDKLFVLLAPQLCQTFAPEAIFHNERCCEKLRIKLIYTGMEVEPRNKQLLVGGVPGSLTWKESDCVRKNEE
uniref:Piwi domain-containing protein n=1 Tax=Caenorhabditis tropicalis TaxID=1561998 RepID=A0A1I7V1L3_9PELO